LARIRSSLHPATKRQLNAAVAAILAKPAVGKPLGLDLAGLRSFRIGRLRLIYRLAQGRTIDFIAFGPRETIYEETSRLIARGAKPPRASP
jgi:mRNA-degrading endonuclease RelE of RelBE toxin-antitoxin system